MKKWNQAPNRLLAVTVMLTAFCLGMMPLLRAQTADWKPPVGIPAPEFGITNSHWSYANSTYDFGSGPTRYPVGANGPFTHYVDMTHPQATDTENPFGTPRKPRMTFPSDLKAGSVVELHGGPYNFRNFADKMVFTGKGTAEKPIYLRGGSTNNRPFFAKDLIVSGSYLIAENLSSAKTIRVRPEIFGTDDADHITFRSLILKGTGMEAGASTALSAGGRWSDPNGPWSRQVVVHNSTMLDYGDWQTTEENDWVGVAVGGYNAEDIWILDNTIYHFGGDSIRIGSNPTPHPYTARRVYIGRNYLYENRENALDVKGIYDVVVSQNRMHSFRPSSSSHGTAIAVHYNCTNIWFLNNAISDCSKAAAVSDAGDIYFVGNTINSVERGVEFWSNNKLHFLNNTFVDFERGIHDIGQGAGPHIIVNNIFSGMKDPVNGYHVRLNSAIGANISQIDHNLFYEANGSFRMAWGGKKFGSLAAFQLETGKGMKSLTDDPVFAPGKVSKYQLQFNSPARGAGLIPVELNNLFYSRFKENLNYDPSGIARKMDAPWDIGAFQSPGKKPAPPKNLTIVEVE